MDREFLPISARRDWAGLPRVTIALRTTARAKPDKGDGPLRQQEAVGMVKALKEVLAQDLTIRLARF